MSDPALIEQINEEIAAFEEAHGVELDDDAWDELGHLMEDGSTAEEAFAAADFEVVDDDDEDYEDDDESDGLSEEDYVEAVRQSLRATIQEVVDEELPLATRQGPWRRPDPQRDFEEQMEADFHAQVEALERDRDRTLTNREREKLWETANNAAHDPSVESDAQVWKQAKEAVPEPDVGVLFDEKLREVHKQQEEREAEEESEATETPGEYLAELEKGEEEYREALDAAVRGEAPSPKPEYEPVNQE